MTDFNKEIQIRWSDLDPNFHLRHSVYYDWGAFCRVEFLYSIGLTAEVMQKFHIGPILFREECVFRKEIRLEDKVTINLKVLKAKRDMSRWTIQHEIKKNGDTLSAVLTVEVAWIDTIRRKLAALPEAFHKTFDDMPLAENFEWIG
ncbi:MAG TPA: acyl-CoA thioesterase [Chitinophagaceae bacterium]